METVKDLMVPIEEYTRVPEDASLYDVIKVLEQAMFGSVADTSRPKDRAVMVQAKDGRVLGKLSLWDVLHGLEPRYALPFEPLVMVDEYFTWTHSMFANLAQKARATTVKNLIREHSRGELIDENASIDAAVHQLVHGRLPSLLVMRGKNVVGILRLVDVFKAVSEIIGAAEAKFKTV